MSVCLCVCVSVCLCVCVSVCLCVCVYVCLCDMYIISIYSVTTLCEYVHTVLVILQIGCAIVPMMDHDNLSHYLQKFGDRIALFTFCERNKPRKDHASKRKSSVLDRLRKKLKLKSNIADPSSDSDGSLDTNSVRSKLTTRLTGNVNASKDVRQVRIGFILKDGKTETHLRARSGGGTRTVDVSKDSTRDVVLQVAKDLFFPEGQSKLGSVDNFTLRLLDYQENGMESSTTVGSIFQITKLPRLTFYLHAERKSWTMDRGADNMTTILDDEADAETDSFQPVFLNDIDVMAASSSFSVFDEFSDDDGEVIVNQGDKQLIDEGELADTLPVEMTIKIHRGHALDDLIATFEDTSVDPRAFVRITMILPDGQEEGASDDGGVTRDCLSEFWQSFYERCTLGRSCKVPCLRHDFGVQQWQAVGKILSFGWRQESYFPIEIAMPFFEQCLFDEPSSDLVDTFLRFVPTSESDVLRQAMEDMTSVDNEELLDVLNDHDCKYRPTAENLQTIIKQIAHKEMIQAPMFIIDCFKDTMKGLGLNKEILASIYCESQPTTRKVLKLIDFPTDMTPAEKACADLVKKYIKELDESSLKLFLKFCTGADQLVGKRIGIIFCELHGLSRRPVAHTCGCILQIPTNYDNFPEFRSEFNSILHSGVWVMDIV